MKPTLFVLAAGMGSRYGGLKQLDGLGPNGETIMDYSIFDAIRGGFGKLVFVIRKSFEQDFREKIVAKYENHIPVEVVFQDLNDLPAGFTCPEGRQKPWGTNHAVLMGKDVIKEPFAVINADDFYGRDSFAVLGKWLSEMDGKQNQYCMVGYRVGNTLSESGSVARGVCETNAEGYLTGVVERTAIERIDGEIQFKDENGEKVVLEEKSIQTAEGLQKSKRRLLGIAMLGKKVPKSVVEKILEYNLSAEQLEEIRQCVESGLADAEILQVMENSPSPERMKKMREIILLMRKRKAGV